MPTFVTPSRVSSAADLQLQKVTLDHADLLSRSNTSATGSKNSGADGSSSNNKLGNAETTTVPTIDQQEPFITIIAATHYLPVVARIEKVALSPSPGISDNNDNNPESVSNTSGITSSSPSSSSYASGNEASDSTNIASPFSEKYQWKLDRRRGHTAMYAGIKSLSRQSNQRCIKIGLLGKVVNPKGHHIDPCELPEDAISKLREVLWENDMYVPIIVPAQVADDHYEGYCKQILWPLLHYMSWDDSAVPMPSWWTNYVEVNKEFAKTIAEKHTADCYIWIQDYHLLLAPAFVRDHVPDARIGLFIHSPFPSSEIFRSLPNRSEILKGMLESNSIGFQTYSYSRHFSSSCTRVLGLESTPTGIDYKGSIVNLGIFPIGIDIEHTESRRTGPNVKAKMDSIRRMYSGKKIIIARDKLDEVSGIIQKLKAFRSFLELYPEWQNKVVLIQVTQPGQRRIPKLETKISEIITSINSDYGSLEFCPIHHHTSFLDTDEYMALLTIADLGLITAIRDGMNTSSLEYVVCQSETHNPLILSEFTGTAGSISGAILINPWDFRNVADMINSALMMSNDEKNQKHRQMYQHVVRHSTQRWAQSFIDDFRKAILALTTYCTTTKIDVSQFTDVFNTTNRRLFLFDYDGTLTPIVNNPEDAVPTDTLLKTLEKLCSDPKNVVWVISGRDAKFLSKHLGHIQGLGLSAEHGCFIRYPDTGNWENLLKKMDMSWKSDVRKIFEFYTERTKGATIEEKESSVTWHYRNADPDYGLFQAKECMNHLENAVVSRLPIEILVGKKCLDVRPKAINKGEIVRRVLLSTDSPNWELIVCAGDDKTDEDMFRALRIDMRNKLRHRTHRGQQRVSSGSGNEDLFVSTPVVPSGAASETDSISSQMTLGGITGSGGEGPARKTVVSSLYPRRRSAPDTDKQPPFYFLISVGPSTKKTKANCYIGKPEALVDTLAIISGVLEPKPSSSLPSADADADDEE
ncbi:hypothetical protein H4219_005375 [Mycoemilia scoparia]|uniref:Uncharacterized protein n=1 Tax=Mycoemilia scoparia TaxID=417184 RepID=A0A9W7ZPG3_9FUNG|nr:hypothetical protein H4219_005375 [Mycoemilia scoparia]